MTNKVDFERVMAGLKDTRNYLEGCADSAAYKVHVPDRVDVRAIRARLKLTQTQFAARYGFSVGAVRDWEQDRRRPEASARILLRIIERRPDVVDEALSAA